jgi:ribosomal protein L37AE/L43A
MAGLSPNILIGPSSMRNEHSNDYTPESPLCPSCGQTMRLARIKARFGDLPDLYIFECRACGVSQIPAAYIEAA